jgi:hypothetical protein
LNGRLVTLEESFPREISRFDGSGAG